MAIYVDKKWEGRIKDYNCMNERILITKPKYERGFLTLIGVYTSELSKKEETNCSDTKKILGKYNKRGVIIFKW